MAITLSDGDVEFLAARVRRLLKAFDYPATEGLDDEAVVRVAGSLLGGLLRCVESQDPVAWAFWADGFDAGECVPQLSSYEPMAYPQRIPLMKQPPKPKMFQPSSLGD